MKAYVEVASGLNRTVPKSVDVMLGFIAGGSYVVSMYDIKQTAQTLMQSRLQLAGALLGSVILCLIAHWLIGWCLGLIRKIKPFTFVGKRLSSGMQRSLRLRASLFGR